MTALIPILLVIAGITLAVGLALMWQHHGAAITRGLFGASADHDLHAELHCLDDPESWDSLPAVRADHAKTRTQKNEARMKAAGNRPWWEAS